jgi:predicted PurR-regulated permease PerM
MLFFEHHNEPLISKVKFYRRLINNSLIALVIIIISLTIGISGYMGFAHMTFVNALLNASMILGGMGPVDLLPNDASKYFASAYALFSGVTFLSIVGVLFAPFSIALCIITTWKRMRKRIEKKKNLKKKAAIMTIDAFKKLHF